MILNSPTISGSLTVTGNIITSGSITLSGSVASASYALNSTTAATASYANAFTVAGILTAQTLVVQTITSSVDFVTGSTRFGSIIGNTHQFTGSVSVSGSINVNAGLRLSSNSSEGEIVGTTGRGLKFYTNDGISNPLNLTSGGNVGVGTTTPQGGGGATDRTLSINAGTGAASFVTGLVGDVKYSTLFTANSIVVLETNAAIPLAFNTNNAERMRVTSGGNINIGFASDTYNSAKVEIYRNGGDSLLLSSPQGTGASNAIAWSNSRGDVISARIKNIDDGNYGANIVFETRTGQGTSTTERMRITSAGRIIINNSVANDSGDRNVSIQGSLSSGGNDVASLSLVQIWNSVSYPAIVSAQRGTNVGVAASDMVFKTSYWNGSAAVTNEHMRITDYGNVGIGVASGISDKLYVNGSVRVNGTITSVISPGTGYALDSAASFTTLINGAYVDFPSMSGMIIVNNTGTGAVQVFICGGGNTASLGYVVNVTGTMTHSPGVGGYRFTNNTGSTWTFAFQVFRTRGTA